jgi:serine/threonine protein kinase/Tol biopolymer transport system component
VKSGDRIGRYVVEGLLGQGGMGQVYCVYDEVLHRRVALKLIRQTLEGDGAADTDGSVQRVLREARMAAALEHANVVAIHDVGEHESVPFIVMELVTGSPLRAFIGAGVPVADRTRWLVEIARALSAAHRVGLVHRDVKPENVIVREDGAVKVLDFGIARRAGMGAAAAAGAPHEGGSAATAAEPSTIAGTPAYMAPEQIRGDALDARSDQFAWGVVAYELLTGRLPWSGTNYFSAALFQSPPPLDASALGVTAAMAAVVMRALEKRPGARFASMDDLMGVFAPSVGPDSTRDVGAITHLPPGSLPEFTSAPTLLATRSAGSLTAAAASALSLESSRRRRWMGAALAAGIAATTAGLVFGSSVVPSRAVTGVVPVFAPTAGYALRSTEPKRLTFDPGCEEFPSLTSDGKTLLFDTSVGTDSHVVALDLASGTRRTLTRGAGWQYAAVVSPDATRFAFLAEHDGRVGTYVAPLDGSEPPRLVGTGLVRPSWSLDGTAIWCGTKERIDRLDVASGKSTRGIDAPKAYVFLHAIELADGRVVASVLDRDHEREPRIMAFSGDGAGTLLVDWDADETLTLAPDGGRLLATRIPRNGRGELWQIPLDGAEPSVVAGGPTLVTKGFAIAGGRTVWSTCRTSRTLSGLNAGTAPGTLETAALFPQTDWDDNSPAAVPTSTTKLVVVSNRSGAPQLWLLDLSDAEPARVLNTADLAPSEPAVSPDGRTVAFTVDGRGLYATPLDGSGGPRALTGRGSDREPAFSRDGKLVYFDAERGAGGRAIESIAIDAPTAPTVVIDHAMHPATSMVGDQLIYVAQAAGEGGTPRAFDLRLGKSAPVVRSFGPEPHTFAAFSRDGQRIAITNGYKELDEVDVVRAAVVRRFRTGDQITGVAYVGSRIVISRDIWGGDLWTAEGSSPAR